MHTNPSEINAGTLLFEKYFQVFSLTRSGKDFGEIWVPSWGPFGVTFLTFSHTFWRSVFESLFAMLLGGAGGRGGSTLGLKNSSSPVQFHHGLSPLRGTPNLQAYATAADPSMT